MEDKLNIAYKALSDKYNVGSIDDFKIAMQDDNKSKKAYEALSQSYNVGDYETFISNIRPQEESKDSYFGDLGERAISGLAGVPASSLNLLGKIANKVGDIKDSAIEGVSNLGGLVGIDIDSEKAKASVNSVIGGTPLGAIANYAVDNSDKIKSGSEYFKGVQENWQNKSDRYKGKDFMQLAKEGKYGDALGEVFLSATQSLPQSLIIAGTGGAGLIGTGITTASDKHDQLSQENPDMNKYAKIGNAIVTGASEALTEVFGAGTLGRVVKNALETGGKRAAAKVIEKNFLDKLADISTKYYAAPVLEEGLEETTNAFVEYAVDTLTGVKRDDSLGEAMLKAGVYGAAGGMQYTPVTAGAHYYTKKSKKRITNTYNETKPLAESILGNKLGDFDAAMDRMDERQKGQFIDNVSTAYGLNKEQKESLLNYSGARISYGNYVQNVEKEITEEQTKAAEEIKANTNKDMGASVILNGGGEEFNVTGGNIVTNADGTINYENSDETVYVKGPDGKVSPRLAKEFDSVASITPLEQLYAERMAAVKQSVIEQEDADIYGRVDDTIPMSFNIGEQVGNLTIQDVTPEGNYIAVDNTGLTEEYTPQDLAAIQVPAENAPEATNIVQPEAVPEVQQPAEEVAQQVQYPLDKEGNVDYNAIQDPEMYASALQEEFGEESVSVINEMLEAKAKELEKAQKNSDSIKKRRLSAKTNAEIERLNGIKAILSPINVSEINAQNEVSPQAGDNNMSEVEQPQTHEEYLANLIESGTDPQEIADAYRKEMGTAGYETLLPWQQQLIGRKINKDSFLRYGDKNKMSGAIGRAWINPKTEETSSSTVDAIAEEISEYGTPVTPEDIIQFVYEHPSNRINKGNEITKGLNESFRRAVKELTGQDVGGVDSNSAKLVMAGIAAGKRTAEEQALLPFQGATIPDAMINFFEATERLPEEFETFEDFNNFVEQELQNGTFDFPLSEKDYAQIKILINNGIEQSRNWEDYAGRTEKARNSRAAEPTVFEDLAKEQTGNELGDLFGEQRGDTEGIKAAYENETSVLDNTSGNEEYNGNEDKSTTENAASTKSDTSQPNSVINESPIDTINRIAEEATTKQSIKDAELDVNINPTDAQKEAGNYKKGHLSLNGFDITIEQPKGSVRSGVDNDGKKWSIELQNTYGYFIGTKGVDGDHIDVFIGDNPISKKVFVVDQINKDGSFDEHKVLFGFDTLEEAKAGYLSNYENGWQGLGNITEVSMDNFDKWLNSSTRKTKQFAEYSFVKNNINESSQHKKNIGYFIVDLIKKTGINVSTDINEAKKALLGTSVDLDEINSIKGLIQKMTAYHGSPFHFTEFDHSFMGNGEGNQAHGWGTYVAKNPDISKGYARFLTNRKYNEAETIDELFDLDWRDRDSIIEEVSGAVYDKLEKEYGSEIIENVIYDGENSSVDFFESIDNEDIKEEITDRALDLMKDIDFLKESIAYYKILQPNFYDLDIPDDTGRNYLAEKDAIGEELLEKVLSGLKELGFYETINEDGTIELEKEDKKIVLYKDKHGISLYNEISKSLGGDKRASEFLSSIGLIGISYDGDIDGECYVIFNDFDISITNHTQLYRTKDGNVYGFVKDGMIYIDPELMNPNTPVHEYTHIWDYALRKSNPELWKRGIKLMKEIPLWNDVISDIHYADIKNDDDLVASEVHSRLTGDKGEEVFSRLYKEVNADGDILDAAEKISTIKRLQVWVNDVWKWLKDTMSPWSKEEAEGIWLTDFVNMPISDLINRVNPLKESRKSEQLNIINKTNPMLDDYHTGIRAKEDIASFDEALSEIEQSYNEYGDMVYPDMSIEDMREAQSSGFITVYSSKSIKQGVFVTPSRMQAEEYAGGGKVYEKRVSTDDIAWVKDATGTEGQMASVKSNAKIPILYLKSKANNETLTKDGINSRFNNELQQQIDGILPKRHVYQLGNPSDILQSAGISDMPIELSSKRLMDKSKQDNHLFDLSDAVNLPEAIQNPIAVFDSKTQPNSKVILTELSNGEKNFVVAIKAVNKLVSGERKLEVNEIKSLYPKDTDQIFKWFQQTNLLKYVNKEKAIKFLNIPQFNSEDDTQVSNNLYATKIINNFTNPTLIDGKKTAEANNLADSLNTPVRLINDVKEIEDEDTNNQKRKRASKGWYDSKTGEVVVVVPNNTNVSDVQATMLHEIVGHKGLRGLLGDKFDDMMDTVYKNLPDAVRETVTRAAMNSYNFNIRTATEEYLASIAEKGVDKPETWNRIKSAIKEVFRTVGIDLKMTDEDIAYLLWKSKNRLEKGDSPSKMISKAAKDADMRDLLYRDPDKDGYMDLDAEGRRSIYDTIDRVKEAYSGKKLSIKKGFKKFLEAYVDGMRSLKKFQEAVEKKSGEKIKDFENAYIDQNSSLSRSTNEVDEFENGIFSDLVDEIINLMNVRRKTIKEKLFGSKKYKDEISKSKEKVTNYMMAKHGLERNAKMREDELQELRDKLDEKLKEHEALLYEDLEGKKHSGKYSEKEIARQEKTIEGIIKKRQENNEEEIDKKRAKLKSVDYSGLTALSKELFDSDTMDEDMIRDYVEEYEAENDTSKLWELTKKATGASLTKMYVSGCISKEIYDETVGMYENYIPLREWAEQTAGDVYEYYFKEEKDIINTPMKTAKGRESKAGDILANIYSMNESSVFVGNKNRTKLKFLNMVRNHLIKNGLGDAVVSKQVFINKGTKELPEWEAALPEGLTDDMERNREILDEFDEKMKELQKEGKAKVSRDFLRLGMPIKKWQSDQHAIQLKENGEDIVIYINGDPSVAQAINGLNKIELNNKVIKAADSIKRFISANYTSRHVDFVARNISRDSWFVNNMNIIDKGWKYEGQFLMNYKKASGAIIRGMLGKIGDTEEKREFDKLFKEFKQHGGRTGFVSLEGYNRVKDRLERKFAKLNGKKLNSLQMFNLVAGYIETMNSFAEDLNRFNVYVTSRKTGQSITQSVNDAKESSVNFNRKGSGAYGARYFNSLFFFFNAGVQGQYRYWSASKRAPVQMALYFMLPWFVKGFMLKTILSSLVGDDDDDWYNNLPDYVRQNNICLKLPWIEKVITIPLSIEQRIFYGLGDMTAQVMDGDYKGRNFSADVASKLMDFLPINMLGDRTQDKDYFTVGNVARNFIPDAVAPFADAYLYNQDFFGKRITARGQYNENKPEYRKATKGTSSIAVKMSEMINAATGGDYATKGWADSELLNPSAVEYIMEQYLGGVGKMMTKTYKSMESVLNGEIPEGKNIPVVGGMSYDTDGFMPNTVVNERYKGYEDLAILIQDREKMYIDGLYKGEANIDNYVNMFKDKDYKIASIVDKFKPQIDNLSTLVWTMDENTVFMDKKAKEAYEKTRKEIFSQIHEMKKAMLNEIDKLK